MTCLDASTLTAAPDEHAVGRALRRLKARAGTHSPSVTEIERALPGAVRVDACFLSNPYATDEVMSRIAAIPRDRLEQMVAQYPSQAGAVAPVVAPALGVPAEQLVVANGASETIQALLARATGPLLLNLPTFSAYYEFALGEIVAHRLDPAREFALDLDALEALVERHRPDTVVVINPNNPDGGVVPHDELVAFVDRVHDRVPQIIVDESFGAFTTTGTPSTLTPLVADRPHLVVVNSLSKSHGIAGLRLGYAVMAPERAQELRGDALWNLNAFAEWFCELLVDEDYGEAYELARRRYIRGTRRFFAGLEELPGTKVHPSGANFALLELEASAADVATRLLVRHGVYVRDCADKWGLEGDRFLRVASRDERDNELVLGALAQELAAA